MAGVPSGGNTIKNIIIGVLTTVVAYAIVHFLFDNGDKKGKEKKKTVTVEAWNTLLKYEALSETNYYAAYCNEDPATQIEQMVYEKDQLIKNYEIIKGQPDIDEDMAAFISRAIGFTNEIKNHLSKFSADFNSIQQSATMTDLEKDAAMNELIAPFQQKIKSTERRDQEVMRTILVKLVDKYGNVFAQPDTQHSCTEEMLTGTWKETGVEKTFELNKDHRFTMSMDNVAYPGTWSLQDTTIRLLFDDQSDIRMHVTRCSKNYFRFKLNEEEEERQNCK